MPDKTPFQVVAGICKKYGVSTVLVGGYALGAYGHQRVTLDVDFMIAEGDLEKFKPVLVENGYYEALRSPLVVRFAPEDKAGTIIDLMMVDAGTFEKVKVDAREATYGGCQFLVPKLEHLIGLKLHALKQQFENRRTKDLPDIVELVRRNQLDVHSLEFRTLCLRFGTEELYKMIVAWVGQSNG
jgi:hypothetical protein